MQCVLDTCATFAFKVDPGPSGDRRSGSPSRQGKLLQLLKSTMALAYLLLFAIILLVLVIKTITVVLGGKDLPIWGMVVQLQDIYRVTIQIDDIHSDPSNNITGPDRVYVVGLSGTPLWLFSSKCTRVTLTFLTFSSSWNGWGSRRISRLVLPDCLSLDPCRSCTGEGRASACYTESGKTNNYCINCLIINS